MSIYHRGDPSEFELSENMSRKAEKSSCIRFVMVTSESCELLVLASEMLDDETSDFGVSVPLLIESKAALCFVAAIVLRVTLWIGVWG